MQKQPTSPAAPDAGGFLLAAGRRALAKAADLDSQRKLTQASSNAFWFTSLRNARLVANYEWSYAFSVI
jgi:hypothetical protein